ncbi:MAG TPA: S41 family peptidase [Pyrinomonadaceae bacterium]|nr:S41 family peptidase [Pyrinomonadaceae bacterium]
MKTKLIGLLMALFILTIVNAKGQQPDLTIDAATRNQVIDGIILNLNKSYIFLETAKAMEKDLRQRIQNKEYDNITSAKEFAQKLTVDLQSISKDKHLRVLYSAQTLAVRKDNAEPTAAEIEENNRFMRQVNFGFEKVERLRGNIGYIDLRGFMDPDLGVETVAAAMNLVSNTESLIFDLRQNGGGDPAMVALICSYLFGDKPVHLNDLYFRESNETTEFWTKPTVSGKRYGDKDVYVLTSSRTFSGAEEFTYNLKNLKRATIIGETTGGGANPGGRVRLHDHFGVFVPTGRAISPVTKTNWEGIGVTPDLAVPQEQALKTAYKMALTKLLEKTTDEQVKPSLKELIEKTQKEIDEMKKN